MRDYQKDFSTMEAGKYEISGRIKKAQTMLAVFKNFFKKPLHDLTLLNVGGSSGIIDNYLADFFFYITSIDIDSHAVQQAKQNFSKKNLSFQIGDAMNLCFKKNSFDVVICSQVYEHVPYAPKMMDEIYRVLKPGGICFFAASNRLMLKEPHYDLLFLSIVPRFLAHRYIKIAKKAEFYHELHYTYWGLKKLVKKFTLFDYTKLIISDPMKYKAEYMISPGSLKHKLAYLISKFFLGIVPGYIWILQKPKEQETMVIKK